MPSDADVRHVSDPSVSRDAGETFDLFEGEQHLAEESRLALAQLACCVADRAAFERLLLGYEKLLRETRRLLRIADRREVDLHRDKYRLGRLTQKLAFEAERDPLTQVFNKGKITALIREAMAQRECCLMIIDIDHFKRINDNYGHPVGDAVLRQIVNLISAVLRDEDCLGRMGGEEFAVLTEEASLIKCRNLAERLRHQVERIRFDLGTQTEHITISIGLTCCHPGDAFEAAFARADTAMYEAKRSGRNRVAVIE